MKKQKQKLCTISNICLFMLMLSGISGMTFVWFYPVIGQALIWNSIVFLCWVVYFEVRGLKDWGEDNLKKLVKMAEVSAEAAYKVKKYGGKVLLDGKEM